jgi:two-component system, OmpR family, copper resistance phosphate regulon response regulator CusR
MNRILIAEDEGRIASFLEKGLRANGFVTTTAGDARRALVLVRGREFDLVILDMGLPGLDGPGVLRELRRAGRDLPFLVLTSRDQADQVGKLNGMVEDAVAKPFVFEDLLARIRVRLRGERAPEETILRVGDLALDLRTRRARVGERTVDLTAREFTLAEVFMRHPGQVLSREQLLSHVWGYDFDPGSNVVDVYVRYLRRKLGAEHIVTVRGMGYRLEAAPGIGVPAARG